MNTAAGARRLRAVVLIGSVLVSGVLLAGCNARTPAASTGGSPAASTAGSPAGSTAGSPAASADSSDAADPLADIESTVDAIERDLDADAG